MTFTRENFIENVLHIAILGAITLIVFALKPNPAFQSRGILLPAKSATTTSAPKTDEIQVLNAFPPRYKVIGLQRVMKHFSDQNAARIISDEEDNLTLARKQAAAQGANAIVITEMARTDKEPQEFNAAILRAVAIRVY